MPVSAAELAAIPLFASLGSAELDEIAGWFDHKSASEGVRLAGESAVGYSFFVIADGNAVVTANGTAVATLGPATSSVRSRSSATASVARPSQPRVRLAYSSCTERSSGSSKNVIQTSPRDSKQRWQRAPRRPSHPS